MTMNLTITRSLVLLLVSALLALAWANPAEARRFGGGKNFGDQGQNFQRSAPNRQQTAPQRQDAGQAANRPAGAGMGGMLAGLAAGGLFAWLLFGGAFDGLQPMDLLLLVLLAFGAFMLVRHLRRQAASGAQHPAPAAGPVMRAPAEPVDTAAHQGPATTPRPGSLMDELGGGAAPADHDYQPPSWFDRDRFLSAAVTHFVNLQQAWDDNRMDEISEFVTPALLAQLVEERHALGTAPNHTEVVELDADLEALGEDGNELVALARFRGAMREERGGAVQQLDETWVIRRDLDDPQAPWLIAGIRQNT
ncbi:MAG: Tim44 domain-containing protein [Halothiobacillaceae bacterium]